MPSHYLIPIATSFGKCNICLELISGNQFYLQCETCTKKINFECFTKRYPDKNLPLIILYLIVMNTISVLFALKR